jgi:predicted O-methyltransferase YrrM
MRPSERAALSGLLAELRPGVALEIGTAAGGSLVCLAEHASRVHSFDLSPPSPGLRKLRNVTFHTGDSHVLLSPVMEELAKEGGSVEFALVDGDHSAEGVRRDVEDLLAASAFKRGIIVLHDTANGEVRDGLERVKYEECSKVTWVDLDWLPGYVSKDTGVAWAGLGLIVIDAAAGSGANPDRA